MSTVTTFKPKRVTPVQRHVAYDSLRRALQLGKIPSGERLREPEWSRRLGVNRIALREAMARLLSEGLVVEGGKGGYFVPSLDAEDVEEIIRLRLMLESTAVDQILRSQRNHPKDLRELQALCNDHEWMLQKGYIADLAEVDQLFHEKLVALSGGPRLCLLYRALPQYPFTPACMDLIRGSRMWGELLAQHRALLDALTSGQCDRAKEMLQEHYCSNIRK